MEKWRQMLHIEPQDGWLNDPNGLCCLNGTYHAYFQHSPASPEGKTTRCWGHFCGDSLADLSYDGIVFRPDIPEDRNGVYSGSAIVVDGKIHFFYTGNVKEEGDYDYITSGRGAYVIHVVSEDGHHMQEKQVVLRNEDYPDFCTCHVRDPKLWMEDGQWHMVLGARTRDDKGCVLIYKSDDLTHWEYETVVSVPDYSYMWECPDYLEVEGKGYLSISPQGIPHQETMYQNVYASGYFPVKGKLSENSFGEFTEWDKGFDFYAPQTFQAPDGRVILLAWMGIGDCDYQNLTTALGWQHCMTLFRELRVAKDGRLLQKPVHEIMEKFGEKKALTKETGKISMPFALFGKTEGDFSISFDDKLTFRYDEKEKKAALTFTDVVYGGDRRERKADLDSCTDICVIADLSSLEIYLNGGEVVFSTRFYPESDQVQLDVCGHIEAEYSNLIKIKGGAGDGYN